MRNRYLPLLIVLAGALAALLGGCSDSSSGAQVPTQAAAGEPAPTPGDIAPAPNPSGWAKVVRQHKLVAEGFAPVSEQSNTIVIHGDGRYELARPNAAVGLGRLSDEEFARLEAAIALVGVREPITPASCSGYESFPSEPVFATHVSLHLNSGKVVGFIEDDGFSKRVCLRGDARSAMKLNLLLERFADARP
jgi:hypothetical protein